MRDKIQSFAHTEFDRKQFTDLEAIARRVAAKEDLYMRKNQKFLINDPVTDPDLPANKHLMMYYMYEVAQLKDPS